MSETSNPITRQIDGVIGDVLRLGTDYDSLKAQLSEANAAKEQAEARVVALAEALDKALQEVDGLRALAGSLAEAATTEIEGCRATWSGGVHAWDAKRGAVRLEHDKDCPRCAGLLRALTQPALELAREWQEGREDSRFIDWLSEHWGYGIDEAPLYLKEPTELRDALRAAIAGKER